MRRFLICSLIVVPFTIGVFYVMGPWSLQVTPPPPTQTGNAAMLPTLKVTPSENTIDDFPETVTISDGSRELEVRYTGRILRKRAVVLIPMRIYEIASYVEEPAEGDTETLLDGLLVDGRAKLFIIRFLMPLPGKAILNDIRIALEESFGDVDMNEVDEEIQRFCSQFGRGSSRGDLVHIVWLKGGKVFSAFEAPERLEYIAEHEAMARAIWRIWTGPESENRIDLVQRYSRSQSQ
jgi:hypothetical protein